MVCPALPLSIDVKSLIQGCHKAVQTYCISYAQMLTEHMPISSVQIHRSCIQDVGFGSELPANRI